MTGGDQPPFRKPCPGSAPANACRRAASPDGARYGHCNPADDGIAKYILSTTVPNPDGGTIAPYETYNSAGSTFPCQEPPAPPPTRNNIPAGGWIGGGAYQFTLVAGQANTAPESWTNSGTANFSVAHKTGSKSVACCLQWNGWWGFDNPDGVGTVLCVPGGLCYNCSQPGITTSGYGGVTHFEPPRVTVPSQTKFTKLDITCSYVSHWSGPNLTNFNIGDSRSISLDENSGEVTSAGSDLPTLTEGVDYPTGYPPPVSLLNKCFRGLAAGLDFVGYRNPADFILNLTDYSFNCSGSGTSHIGGSLVSNSGGVLETWDADFSGLGFEWHLGDIFHIPIISGGVGFNGLTDQTLHISADSETVTFTWTETWCESWSYIDPPQFYVATCTAVFSNPWTKDDMNADMASVLSNFPLNGKEFWRMDGLLQVAPLLTRNQVEANVAPNTVPPLLMDDANGNHPGSHAGDSGQLPIGSPVDYVSTPWKDPNVWQWQGESYPKTLVQIRDGNILGIPKPAGYEDAFCYQFRDWQGGSDPTAIPEVFDWCIFGWGMRLLNKVDYIGYNAQTGAQLPLNATQWTSNYECINKPPGAYLGYADPTLGRGPTDPACHSGTYSGTAYRAGAFWGVKYAEIIDTWPSQNFARPGGDDLFLVDESKVYSAANVSGSGAGSVWALTTPGGGAVASINDAPSGTTPHIVTSGSIAGNWGGTVVGGWYSGCSFAVVSGVGQVTLGTKAFTVPTGWQSKSYIAGTGGTIDDTDIMFGQLRFPDCPSLLGRAVITMAGTTATFGSAQPAFGMAVAGTEQVDIYDSGMTLLTGNVTATRVDDTHFTLAVNYPGAAFAMIHGTSAKWYINDDTPKGHCAVLEFGLDFRTNLVVNRLAGVTDCDGNNPPAGSPAANNGYSLFSQTPGCLPTTTACGPRVVCVSPNGETWENGITIPFPTDFALDERYGSKWQADIYATMSDLFYQPPHAPCLGYAIQWFEDDGTCLEPVPGGVHDWDSAHYPHDIPVECELTLPANYGPAQNESAPALPTGIVIGWLSPVTNAPGPGVAAPKNIPTFDCTGLPLPTLTEFILHSRFCGMYSGCIFATNYAAGQNGC